MSSIAWKEVNWPLVNSRLLRYQTRIFKAARENNIPKVRCLQKRLLKSLDAKLVAVRRVTTLNKSRVDRKLFLTDIQKGKLVEKLRLNGKALPIRRVYIDKPGKAVEDRAKQALCKLALEPEWEARFEPNSYGSRPGRNCHDAIEAIFLATRNGSGEKDYHKYVLDADLSKSFDQIDHKYLIDKLNTLPEIETQVNAWLKAGIMEEFLDSQKENGIFENIMIMGGIISPLLFNIALHGLEEHMNEWISTKPSFGKINRYCKNTKRKSLTLIRYVDDFVLIHKNENIIREAKEEISKWLNNGPRLQLNEEKTSIRNTSNGFNFLGFSIITIRKGNKPRIKIYPSRKSQAQLLLKVRQIIQKNRSASSYNLINLLRPIIIGWANYFKFSECGKTFNRLSHLIYQKLRAWVFRRDTRNGRRVVKQRYFPNNKSYTFGGTKHYSNWVLNGRQLDTKGIIRENWLPLMTWVKSEKWVKIKGTKSPFDGDNLYWGKRRQVKGSSSKSKKVRLDF